MNITKLSAYLEEFLALKRAMAEADPHYDPFDRRSLRHKEKLLKNFLAFWQHHGRPWPIRAAHVLDWLAAESHPQHPYRDTLVLPHGCPPRPGECGSRNARTRDSAQAGGHPTYSLSAKSCC